MMTLVLCGDCMLTPSFTACLSLTTVTGHLKHTLLFPSHKGVPGILKTKNQKKDTPKPKPGFYHRFVWRTVVLQRVPWIKEMDGQSCFGVRNSNQKAAYAREDFIELYQAGSIPNGRKIFSCCFWSRSPEKPIRSEADACKSQPNCIGVNTGCTESAF